MEAPFVFHQQVHSAGNARCPTCRTAYPQPCVCGGLIHGAGELGENTEIITATECDQCGGSRDELEQADVA